ncbi:hypothetical protein ACHQM5_028522 [Ranunculus cassubicifolius]
MVQKRPFGDEESHEHSWKQPRHYEYSYEMSSFVDAVSRNDLAHRSHSYGYEGEGFLNKFQYTDIVTSENEFEDLKSEAAVGFSYFPELFEYSHSTRQQSIKEQLYSPSSDFVQRKHVAIGPDHQAVIPEQGINVEDINTEKMLGTCVIPMPEESDASIKVGNGRSDCSCQDKGSLRCVRHHISETREKLMVTLGKAAFMELGFCDMGEHVASNWNEEEEHIFNEVVMSNPASLGKNFWDHLSVVFPSRTKKEIVSYYFNVFILRKRGEQNRLDPLNIDSDNDEWQIEDDEEEDDSVVESPHNGFHQRSDHDLEISEDDDEDDDDDDEDDDDDVGNYDKNESSAKGENSNDDSCTSYEPHISNPESSFSDAKQVCRGESDHNNHFNGFGYDDMEHCDTKHWDVEFLSLGKTTDVDLLPTCNMIEEVFGDETCNSKEKDGDSTN